MRMSCQIEQSENVPPDMFHQRQILRSNTERRFKETNSETKETDLGDHKYCCIERFVGSDPPPVVSVNVVVVVGVNKRCTWPEHKRSKSTLFDLTCTLLPALVVLCLLPLCLCVFLFMNCLMFYFAVCSYVTSCLVCPLLLICPV